MQNNNVFGLLSEMFKNLSDQFSGANFSMPGINSPVTIEAGQTVAGPLNAVNGSLFIGPDCTIRGDCNVVNGRTEIGENTKMKGLITVNGDISAAKNVCIEGRLQAVTGTISCEPGCRLLGEIYLVKVSMTIENTEVRRYIKINDCDLVLRGKSVVKGSIIAGKSRTKPLEQRQERIEVTGGSVVEGDIIIEDDTIDARVTISKGGEVKGKIVNAEVIRL